MDGEEFDSCVGRRKPPWLSVNVRVLDGAGRLLKAGRDLAALRDEFRATSGGSTFAEAAPDFAWERVGVRQWDFAAWPVETTVRSGRLQLRAYPGIQDEGASVRLHLFTTEGGARRASRAGIVRLAALAAAAAARTGAPAVGVGP